MGRRWMSLTCYHTTERGAGGQPPWGCFLHPPYLMAGLENPLPIGQSIGYGDGLGCQGSGGWRINVLPVARPSR